MKIKIFILGILLSSQITTYAQISSDAERYDYFFLEAMTEREKGNASAAFELLRHCLEINPEASETYYYLAHYYLGMKQNGKALEAFRKASELEPDNVSYLETLAQMYLQSQDLKAATETFEKLSKAEPEREDVLGMLVQLYSEDEKQYSKAIDILNRLEEIDGMNERISYAKADLYWKMDNGKAALAEMKKLADQYPYDLNYRNAYADMLLANDQDKKAFDIYRGILKEEPGNSKVLMSLRTYFLAKGNTAAADSTTIKILTESNANTDEKIYILRQEVMESENNGGDSIKVLSLFERTISAKDSDPGIGLLMASYMQLKNMPKEDINRVLEGVLNKAPDNASARLQLIADAWEKKDLDRVVNLCAAARQYNPDEMAFYYYQGVALAQQDKNAEAIEAFRNGIGVIKEDSSPDIVSDLYAILGDLLYQDGYKQEAFAAYDSCLQWKPENYSCLNNYAYFLCEDGGDLEKAEKMSYKAIKAEAKNATFLDTYAWILFKQERFAEAKIYIEQTLQCDSDSSAVIIEHAGDIYAKCDNIDKAVELWKEALRKSPDNEILARKVRQRKYIRETKK
ncbi:MAG: tetratricopeptide repeat protein [Prevotella sp.]|nr:tetratricopeptide repeat protein [Prevotella sp.]